jgi:protein-tyrosine-phosphatase/DNA-binding transcriptional ArsR family regulator
MSPNERARLHAALGDAARIRMVDALLVSDRTFRELAAAAGQPGNAAAHHLGVLEAAGLIERRVSGGDRRRRYISLRHQPLDALFVRPPLSPGLVLFVCTHNSARSQAAAAMWRARTGRPADSAGASPAAHVHPKAVLAAAELGFDLGSAAPKGYGAVQTTPDLVVSVCDRAHEAGTPFAGPSLHWSVPDPVPVGTIRAFRSAFADLASRVDRLAARLA